MVRRGSGHVIRQSFGERRQWGGSYGPRFCSVRPLPRMWRPEADSRLPAKLGYSRPHARMTSIGISETLRVISQVVRFWTKCGLRETAQLLGTRLMAPDH